MARKKKEKSLERVIIKERAKISSLFFIIFTVFYLDIITKHLLVENIFNIGLLYSFLFNIPFILIIYLLSKLLGPLVNKIFLFIWTAVLTVFYEAQFIHHSLFSTPLSVQEFGLANQALDFIEIVKNTIVKHAPTFLLLLVPFILLIIINKFLDTNRLSIKKCGIVILLILITYGASLVSLLPGKDQNHSAYKLYYNIDDSMGIINQFGLPTFSKIDIKRALFGYKQELISDTPVIINKEPEEIVYGDNIVDIDFAAKASTNRDIQTLNDYFVNAVPSNQTKYTGMFKGKNLIFILAEGFNEIAVDETRTPTLYKLIHEGFYFTNFYSPVFLSTTGGEFQATTGLIPTSATLNTWKSKTPSIYYAIGNSFGRLGYRAQSYHNWTYSYYGRQKTMPTQGFNNYLGCGNGLEDLLYPDHNYPSVYKCKWLEYDSDMARVTTPLYLGQDGNFVTYYVTVSGHTPYTLGSNVSKHYWYAFENTDYDLEIKNYLASQMELDAMVAQLIEDLTASGELDNTVIALVGDHNPYDISLDKINSVASYQKDEIVERNRSNFILWSSSMEEPIVVDKVGSQIDVLPTLLNLFGVEYDSRLIVGKDILSDYEGIAIFSNYSWVTDYGTYFSNQRRFVPKEGKELLEPEEDYINRIKQRVTNSFTMSNLIISTDYYSYILKQGE